MSSWEGFAGSFLRKIAIAARLFGKELQRNKLKWFDLRRADYRLGEKMLAAGVSAEHSQFAQRVNQIDDRLMSLRQLEHKSSDAFGEKLTAWWSRMVRKAKIAALERKRRSTLKQLGAAVRKSLSPNVPPSDEAHAASQIAEKIGNIDASIRELRASTYVWARRPFLTSSLVLLLAIVGLASFKTQKQSLFVRQDNSSSSLSEDQFKAIQSQTQAFRDQLLRQQAELHRQEADATQARMAAAERQSKEQRAEVAKRAQVQAQKAEQARREQAEREKQQAAIAAIEQARLDREEAEAEKLAREKAEREKVEEERVAEAERVRKEEETQAAKLAEEKRQREEDERAAQRIPASQLIAKSDLEAIMGFAVETPEDREVKGKLTRKGLSGVEEASSCFFASASPPTDHSFKGVMITVRYLREKDEDQAEMVVRNTMGKVEFGSPDLFLAYVPNLGYGGFFYRDFDNEASDSIFVFKPTLRGCILLQVGIEGAPSEESRKNTGLWHEHLVDRETKIALKILGPPRVRVARYEARHPAAKEETQSSYLPDIPGVDQRTMRFFNGMFNAVAKGEADTIANSKSIVAASGGTKMLCPKCGGCRTMVQHTYDSRYNPYRNGTLPNSLYEMNRESTRLVNCDKCGGTGVVDAR